MKSTSSLLLAALAFATNIHSMNLRLRGEKLRTIQESHFNDITSEKIDTQAKSKPKKLHDPANDACLLGTIALPTILMYWAIILATKPTIVPISATTSPHPLEAPHPPVYCSFNMIPENSHVITNKKWSAHLIREDNNVYIAESITYCPINISDHNLLQTLLPVFQPTNICIASKRDQTSDCTPFTALSSGNIGQLKNNISIYGNSKDAAQIKARAYCPFNTPRIGTHDFTQQSFSLSRADQSNNHYAGPAYTFCATDLTDQEALACANSELKKLGLIACLTKVEKEQPCVPFISPWGFRCNQSKLTNSSSQPIQKLKEKTALQKLSKHLNQTAALKHNNQARIAVGKNKFKQSHR